MRTVVEKRAFLVVTEIEQNNEGMEKDASCDKLHFTQGEFLLYALGLIPYLP